jgi:uncharacterized protein
VNDERTVSTLTRGAWVHELEGVVRRHLASESSGHDYHHAFRVRDLGCQIAAVTGADPDVVEAAALLHDIGHGTGRADHARRGAELATETLSKCGFPKSKIDAVAICIEHHHWKPDRADDPRRPTAEYQAFADADRLDALGAVGIARTFAFGGANGRPIWNPEPDETVQSAYGISSIHHFYDKLLRLPNDMYTEPGRRLAAHRVAVMEEFLRAFYLEWGAQDFGLDDEADHKSSLTAPAHVASDEYPRAHPSDLRLDPSA